ncbi:MAG TPA: succinylglutamate desuccinylase/aspartoacylase family protein [Sedimentisphaerales bacterium]|nr:succinylglutamate desuccinylase/aspartoacylase family protein [Sedimentisphaerales bacterium]
MRADRLKNGKVPQRIKYSFLKIMTGSDLSRRRLPFMSVQSANPGPVVWLTGCIHGDEVTGIVTIQEVFKRIQRQHLLRGAVHAFPLMNPIGFETVSRNITLSREDLNRAFPGNPNGSLAERIAERIFSTIRQTNPSLVLDLHNDWMKSIPYTLIDPNPGGAYKAAYEKTKAVAGKSGFLIILETEELTKSFTYNLLQHNIPALTIELGESYVVNEENVEYGVKSILAILAHLEMVENTDAPFSFQLPQPARGKVLKFSPQPVSSASGIIRFLVNPGDLVRKGQPVAKIYNTFGKLLDTILSQADGIVLGHSDSSVAFPGAPVMAFGIL